MELIRIMTQKHVKIVWIFVSFAQIEHIVANAKKILIFQILFVLLKITCGLGLYLTCLN